ncbi:MAG: DUF2784 domain-containing protein [Deltaproteobacteria bacterium]|nr:DUF2784 domain-containing protein [Deltaproteobacteria bacterium]
MIFRILADITILLHLAWILFLISGFIFALKKSKIAFFHIAGLVFTFFLNLMQWHCPLTYLENYLRVLSNSNTNYTGSFIINYSENIIYLDLPELYLRISAIFFVVLNIIGYAYLIIKYGYSGKISTHK